MAEEQSTNPEESNLETPVVETPTNEAQENLEETNQETPVVETTNEAQENPEQFLKDFNWHNYEEGIAVSYTHLRAHET